MNTVPKPGTTSTDSRLSLWLATIITIIWMFFIFLVAFARKELAIEITSGLTLGLLLALIVVLVAWLLAAFYFIVGNRQPSVADIARPKS